MSQLPGGLELEKQRRKINLIEVWGLFLAAFYVVTGLREFKQPRFQLSGSLELGKQRREITSN